MFDQFCREEKLTYEVHRRQSLMTDEEGSLTKEEWNGLDSDTRSEFASRATIVEFADGLEIKPA